MRTEIAQWIQFKNWKHIYIYIYIYIYLYNIKPLSKKNSIILLNIFIFGFYKCYFKLSMIIFSLIRTNNSSILIHLFLSLNLTINLIRAYSINSIQKNNSTRVLKKFYLENYLWNNSSSKQTSSLNSSNFIHSNNFNSTSSSNFSSLSF